MFRAHKGILKEERVCSIQQEKNTTANKEVYYEIGSHCVVAANLPTVSRTPLNEKRLSERERERRWKKKEYI